VLCRLLRLLRLLCLLLLVLVLHYGGLSSNLAGRHLSMRRRDAFRGVVRKANM
jgi:hypothetical protein